MYRLIFCSIILFGCSFSVELPSQVVLDSLPDVRPDELQDEPNQRNPSGEDSLEFPEFDSFDIEWFEDGGEESIIDPEVRKLMNQAYDRCYRSRQIQDSVRYGYFMAQVYGPAMLDAALPAENRRFLVHLKRYLECPTDSCGRGDRLLRPVHIHERDSTHKCHVIADEFPPDESSVDYDGRGWGDDTLISPKQRERLYRIVYANSPEVKYAHMRRFHVLPGACEHYKGYELRRVPIGDTLRPAFASTFDLELEWKQDPVMDSLLQRDCGCRNAFKRSCDPERSTYTFARLKGVPRLWFVSDMGDWSSWYPTRGLMMDYEGQLAIELWRRQMELVGCSCI